MKRLVLIRALQLAQSRSLKKPDDICYAEAFRWARYTVDNFKPSDEQKSAIIVQLLVPNPK